MGKKSANDLDMSFIISTFVTFIEVSILMGKETSK